MGRRHCQSQLLADPMRVGLIIYGSLAAITGGYIYDRQLVEYLRERGVVVKIFSQAPRKYIRNNFSNKIIQDILEFSPDVLLQDEMNFGSLLILNWRLKKKFQFPILSIVHLLQANARQNPFIKWMTMPIEKQYLRSVNGFIFNSLSTEKSITQLIGKNKNSLIAYPGKDRFQWTAKQESISLKCQKNPFRMIFIGNLLYNKGLHLLLQALAQIDYPFWQLSIVGNVYFDLKYTKKILKTIVHFNLENKITLKGKLGIDALKQELHAQHVLIVPSYFESYGIVYAEAMGAGIPVIASKSGGVPEIVEHQRNGFLITPGDSLMLKECILKLMTNRGLLEKMSKRSQITYQNLPSWNETMVKVHEFLNQNHANFKA